MESRDLNQNCKTKVVVGMSGGVDSSVAALLLSRQGYEVVGLFMQNWEEEGCSAAEDYLDVVAVCEQLGITYYHVNFSDEYREQVFAHFLAEYAAGRTPNPDILCNREIKFKVFYEHALKLGADFLATGHYARVDNQSGQLLKARDTSKDQSYFLHAVEGRILRQVLFPLGDYLKSEVRIIAKEANLCTHQKKDSTGICFIGEQKMQLFLNRYLQELRGEFRNLQGELLGVCSNILALTLGQRKGLGLGGQGEPYFVVGKDLKKRIVWVERGTEHPALFVREIRRLGPIHWIAEIPALPAHLKVKVRYRQEEHECFFDGERILFKDPERAVTPGQSVVFYQGEKCLGGAVIEELGPTLYEENLLSSVERPYTPNPLPVSPPL